MMLWSNFSIELLSELTEVSPVPDNSLRLTTTHNITAGTMTQPMARHERPVRTGTPLDHFRDVVRDAMKHYKSEHDSEAHQVR